MKKIPACPHARLLVLASYSFADITFTVYKLGDLLAAQTKRFYRPELDVLRFFAFFCVFAHHTLNVKSAGGRFGGVTTALEVSLSFAVSLFFMLSAFLITTLLEMELQRNGHIHVQAFYVRRITRIWPLYYIFLLVNLGISIYLVSWRISNSFVAAWVLMVGNWYMIVQHSILTPMTVLWSVNIEEQFYLFCPWIVAIFRRKGLIAFAMVTIAISMATLFWMGHRHIVDDNSLRFNTLVELQYFAVGTIVAMLVRRRDLTVSPFVRAALFSLGLCCWVGGTYFFDSRCQTAHLSWWSPASEYALVNLGCLAFFFSFYGLTLGKAMRPFIYLGKISYGLYLYHILFAVMVRGMFSGHDGVAYKLIRTSLSLGLTIVTASASYAWLEKPFLRLKERFTFVQSRAA